jgi:alpha-tubulin suppressor-like RCC1 family protein
MTTSTAELDIRHLLGSRCWPWSVTSTLAISMLAGLSCISGGILETAPDVDYVAISTANHHSCGLTTNGEIYCWANGFARPALVSGDVRFTSVSTYWDHTCGVGENRRAYCWGFNSFGQLGIDQPVEVCAPVPGVSVGCTVGPTPVAGDLEFTTVSVGAVHTCGLTPEGDAYCWGSNSSGQLGTMDEPECSRVYIPEGVACSPVPHPVDGGLTFDSISAGRSHTCALTATGEAYCWGLGGSGRLGNGSTNDSPIPTPVVGGLTFSTLSVGGSHTCGIADAAIYCWGSNSDLQLGTLDESPLCPLQVYICLVAPHRVDVSASFIAVTASDATPLAGAGPPLGGHTCGLVSDGRVYCWGLNEQGQLASTNAFRSAVPVELNSEDRFSAINAGLSNTCGLTMNRGVRCWSYGSPLSQWSVPES